MDQVDDGTASPSIDGAQGALDSALQPQRMAAVCTTTNDAVAELAHMGELRSRAAERDGPPLAEGDYSRLGVSSHRLTCVLCCPPELQHLRGMKGHVVPGSNMLFTKGMS